MLLHSIDVIVNVGLLRLKLSCAFVALHALLLLSHYRVPGCCCGSMLVRECVPVSGVALPPAVGEARLKLVSMFIVKIFIKTPY